MKKVRLTNCIVCNSPELNPELTVQDHSISKESFEIWKCSACSFHFTQDVPTAENISTYYQSEDYISHSNTNKGVVNQLYHRVRNVMLSRKSKLIQSFIPSGRILDYGSGTGYFPAYLQKKGRDVEGIEIDEGARAFAKRNFQLDLKDPKALNDDTFENQSFSGITMWHVLEHLYDPGNYIERFNELLVSKGHLIIAVPNRLSTDAQYYNSFWAAYDVPRHLWHFDPDSMKRLVEQSGFKLIEVKSMPFDAFYVSLLSEKYKTGKASLLKGFWQGFRSYIKSISNPNLCSSVIYIFRKS